jgi:hypothetical protein
MYRVPEIEKFTEEQKKVVLQNNGYITLKINGKLENKTYKITNLNNDSATLEYATFSKFGKILTIIKTISIQELLNNVGVYYIMHGNSKIPLIKSYQNSLKEDKKINRKETLANIANKFSSIFKIPVEITDKYVGMENKKA